MNLGVRRGPLSQVFLPSGFLRASQLFHAGQVQNGDFFHWSVAKFSFAGRADEQSTAKNPGKFGMGDFVFRAVRKKEAQWSERPALQQLSQSLRRNHIAMTN